MTAHASSHVVHDVLAPYRRSRLAAVLTLALMAACGVDQADEPFGTGTYETNVLAQLDASSQTLAAKGLHLQLVNYTPSTSLDSDTAVGAAKAEILHTTAMVPQFNGVDASSLKLDTIAQRMQAYRAGTDTQDVAGNIQSMALPSIKVGQRALDVTWESDGRQFQSKLVYDENGVVYDNMLSNLALIQAEELTAETPPGPPDATADSSGVHALANQSFTTRFLDLTIKWVWGGTRGKVQLDHYVISCDGWRSFCDEGGASNAWMSIGSASGQTRRNALIKPRIAKRAWGYGWATPTASFSITWHPGSLTFSASVGGVGSAGHGAGVHTIF